MQVLFKLALSFNFICYPRLIVIYLLFICYFYYSYYIFLFIYLCQNELSVAPRHYRHCIAIVTIESAITVTDFALKVSAANHIIISQHKHRYAYEAISHL